MADRVAVGGQQVVATREGHRQREYGAARHMEICHHRIDQLEAEAGKYEETRETLGVASDGVGFERTRAAGADRDYAAADPPREFDRRGRRRWNRVPFGLHRMALDLRRAHRSERART